MGEARARVPSLCNGRSFPSPSQLSGQSGGPLHERQLALLGTHWSQSGPAALLTGAHRVQAELAVLHVPESAGEQVHVPGTQPGDLSHLPNAPSELAATVRATRSESRG